VSVRDRSGIARDDMVVTALHELAPHLDGEPDPAFRTATRARLVAMAAVRTPAPEPVTGFKRLLAARAEDVALPRWRTRLTAGLAGAALTVTAAASLVALSSGARPGDVLYGLKRGTEQTQLALAGDARGQTLLDFASTRLDELETLVDDAPGALPAAGGTGGAGGTLLAAGADPELVISTLETMDDQTTEGTAWLTDRAVSTGDAGPLDDLADWTTTQSDGLAALAPELPDAAGAAVSHSLTLLTEVSTRTDGLQGALTCPTGPAVGAADELGPAPAICAPAAPETPTSGPGAGVPGTGPSTQATPPAVPTTPPTGGTGSGGTGTGGGTGGTGTGGGTGGLPVPGTPTIPGGPSLPVPGTPAIPGLPTITVPLPGADPSTPVVQVPPVVPSVDVCLPPLVTIGGC
jgi:hypothetical protein